MHENSVPGQNLPHLMVVAGEKVASIVVTEVASAVVIFAGHQRALGAKTGYNSTVM